MCTPTSKLLGVFVHQERHHANTALGREDLNSKSCRVSAARFLKFLEKGQNPSASPPRHKKIIQKLPEMILSSPFFLSIFSDNFPAKFLSTHHPPAHACPHNTALHCVYIYYIHRVV